MTDLKAALSFVATIKCQVEGMEGFLDVHSVTGAPSGQSAVREPTVNLTVNNYYNFPEVDPESRCRFHFRALGTPEGEVIYNIVAAVEGKELQCVAKTRDGGVFFQPFPEQIGGPLEFWYLKSAPGGLAPDTPGKYAGVWLERYISDAEQQWLQEVGADWPAGSGFYALRKTNSGRYWNGRFSVQAGPDRTPFLGDLYISRMGLYDVETLEAVDLDDFAPGQPASSQRPFTRPYHTPSGLSDHRPAAGEPGYLPDEYLQAMLAKD